MQLKVEGMTCAHCERAVKQAVASLGGTAQVDLSAGTVKVEGIDDAAAVRQAIEAEGYTVSDTPADVKSAGGCGCNRGQEHER